MQLTTPNLEKHVKVIVGFFERNKSNVRNYELESLESVLKHIESGSNNVVKGHDLLKKTIGLLMFHYSIRLDSAKSASFLLGKDLNMDLEYTIFKLHSIISNQLLEAKLKDFNNISEERKQHIIDTINDGYTDSQVEASINKMVHDLLVCSNHKK